MCMHAWDCQLTAVYIEDDADYIGVRETLTFQAGQANHSIVITLVDDDISEDTEHFTASLFSSMFGVQIPSPQNTVINILDNDGRS